MSTPKTVNNKTRNESITIRVIGSARNTVGENRDTTNDATPVTCHHPYHQRGHPCHHPCHQRGHPCHLSPPLSPSLSPPLSPTLTHMAVARQGGKERKRKNEDVLSSLKDSLDALLKKNHHWDFPRDRRSGYFVRSTHGAHLARDHGLPELLV